MDIVALAKELQTRVYSPPELAKLKMEVAGEYGFICSLLEKTLYQKAVQWGKLRATVKTNAEADRLWEASQDGINEMGYKLRLKAMERILSAISTTLRTAEVEKNNQW